MEGSVEADERPPKLYTTCFNDPRLADMTIICGDIKINAHKIVLARGSKFFHRLVFGNFQEAGQGHRTVELHDDPPDAVHAMLAYIYGRTYEHAVSEAYGSTWEVMMCKFLPHVQMYILADKYGMEDLFQAAWDGIQRAGWKLPFHTYEDELFTALRLFFMETPATSGPDREKFITLIQDLIPGMKHTEQFRKLVVEAPEFALAALFAGFPDSKLECANCKGNGKPLGCGDCGRPPAKRHAETG